MARRLASYLMIGIMFMRSGTGNSSALAYDDSGTIGVSGTVAPRASAFSVALQASTTDTVSQDTTITYRIRYESTGLSAYPLTLQATWGQGTIEGAPTATVQVVDYVPNSATQAYGATAAVYNLQAQTLTWSIASLPGGSGTQEVVFQLKTTSSYTGSKHVTFPVTARITEPVGVSDATVSGSYLYVASSSSATTSPTSLASAAPTSTPIATLPPSVLQLSLVTVDTTQAVLFFTTSRPVRAAVSYGREQHLLDTSSSPTSTTTLHRVELSKLHADSQYFAKIYWVSEHNTQIPISDILHFRTASDQAERLQPLLLSAGQQWGISYSYAASKRTSRPIFSAVKGSVVDLHFLLPNSATLQTAVLLISPAKVLGSTTDNSDAFQSQRSVAMEIADSVYIGKLAIPPTSDLLTIVVEITDLYGSKTQVVLADVYSVNPWQVQDHLGRPLPAVRALLYRYNEKLRLYELFPNTVTRFTNPVLSDAHGVLDVSLLPGRYQAELSKPGYAKTQVQFEITSDTPTVLPTSVLTPHPPIVQLRLLLSTHKMVFVLAGGIGTLLLLLVLIRSHQSKHR